MLSTADIFRELNQSPTVREQHCLASFASQIGVDQYRLAFAAIARLVPPPAKALDWGCGHGGVSFALLKSGYNVAALDIKECMLAPELKATFPHYTFTRVSPGNGPALPFPDTSFDLVTSFGVLEHVREGGIDEVDSLKEIRRVLKPGGTFLCCHLPNRYAWVDQAARAIGKTHHRFKYTPAAIRRLCRESGLDLQEHQRYGVLPRNIWRKLPGRLPQSRMLAALVNALDDMLLLPFAAISTNHLFVAVRPN